MDKRLKSRKSAHNKLIFPLHFPKYKTPCKSCWWFTH